MPETLAATCFSACLGLAFPTVFVQRVAARENLTGFGSAFVRGILQRFLFLFKHSHFDKPVVAAGDT
jgi:hypothetical protein